MDRVARKLGIEVYLAKWQEKLRLTEWDIYFEDIEPENNREASVLYSLDSQQARVRIGLAVPPDCEEAEVVHELLELVLADVAALIEVLAIEIPETQRRDLEQRQERMRHRAIHKLTSAFLGPKYEPYPVIQ